MFEIASGGGIFGKGQGGEVFIQLIVGYKLGQAVKVQTDGGNSSKIIIESTFTLSPQNGLLFNGFAYLFKAINGKDSLLNNGGGDSFFSW